MRVSAVSLPLLVSILVVCTACNSGDSNRPNEANRQASTGDGNTARKDHRPSRAEDARNLQAINDLYQRYFARDAEKVEAERWLQRLRSGDSLDDIEAILVELSKSRPPSNRGDDRRPSGKTGEYPNQPDRDGGENDGSPTNSADDEKETDDTPRAPDQAELIALATKSLVRIDVRTIFGQKEIGSGYLADDTGVVVTNYHVVKEASSAHVTFSDGTRLRVSGFIAASQGKDIAILQVEPGIPDIDPLKHLSELPRQGIRVFALGSPRGLSGSVTDGIVSAVRTGEEIVASMPVVEAAYRRSGSDPRTVWIQTSTPISPGNSGGPLIDEAGKVVGVNSWSRPDAQNLNFAVACTEVIAMLETRIGDPKPLIALPRIPDRPEGPEPDPGRRDPRAKKVRTARGGFRIVLPHGKVVESSMFLDLSGANILERYGTPVATVEYPGGAHFALAKHEMGTLDGPAIAKFENGQLMFFGNYENGKRQASFVSWNAVGERQFFAQYTKGILNGIVCVFDHDDLALILEYTGEQIEGIHVVVDGAVDRSFQALEEIPADDPLTRERIESFGKVEHESVLAEAKMRRLVRKFELIERRYLAGKRAVQNSARLKAARQQRAAQNAATISELRRRSFIE